MSNQKKESILKISEEILDYLLDFREQNPEFTFCLRTRDSPQSKDERLQTGHWFQGSNYIFVPLYKEGDKNNKTKTIGFVLCFDDNGEIIANYLEIVFGAINKEKQEFYKTLADCLGAKLETDKVKYIINYPNFDYIKNLHTYITTQKTIIDDLLEKYNLSNDKKIKITNQDFEKWLKNTQEIRQKLYQKTTISLQLNDKFDMSKFPLNQILYGPPGTGKTYHTINKALAIIENKSEIELDDEDRIVLKKRFDDCVESGQIVFTTFHQSMSYEDFIEGIKPIEPLNEGENMVYRVVDGIFKRICIDAAFAIAQQKKPKDSEKIIDFSMQYDNYIDRLEAQLLEEKTVKLITKSNAKILIDGISANQNIIVKHLEGKRPYIISKSRLTKLNQAFSDLDNMNNIDAQFRNVIGGSNATGYWAVLNAIRKTPFNAVEKGGINKIYSYEEKKEVVSAMSKSDYSFTDNEKRLKPYVLIIDEINRGNVSQIFGELITLIEKNKRLGCDEDLKVTLPYSKEPFGVPSNVFIIGTMNTADRSVEALDTALRRRFSFTEMPPKPELIKTEGALKNEDGIIEGINLRHVLITINERIEVLLNRDNLIGHSYFLRVDSLESLKETIFKNILPLLQEYFFGDYGKIGLVMGKGFVKQAEEHKKVIFAAFNYPDTEGVQKTVYELKKQEEVDIKTAIEQLLNE